MYSTIQIHDLRGAIHGFVCSSDREDWRIFLEALDTDDGERLMRALGVEGHRRIAVVGSIVIHEDCRGRNMGATMLRQFFKVAAADAVMVAATRPSREFFKAMGFVPYGETGLMLMKPADRHAHPLRLAA
jgi:N-acetylglutamate synthase-like GNAT family acetyltransferase